MTRVDALTVAVTYWFVVVGVPGLVVWFVYRIMAGPFGVVFPLGPIVAICFWVPIAALGIMSGRSVAFEILIVGYAMRACYRWLFPSDDDMPPFIGN